MSQPPNRKPPPARLPDTDRPRNRRRAVGRGNDRVAETRVRKDSGRASENAARPQPADYPAPDTVEAVVEQEGSRWTVRVLGRAGGPPGGRSPPILLLGFWRGERSDAAHELEATVVGRSLSTLSADGLSAALADASPPRASVGRKPFFDSVGRRQRAEHGRERANEPDP